MESQIANLERRIIIKHDSHERLIEEIRQTIDAKIESQHIEIATCTEQLNRIRENLSTYIARADQQDKADAIERSGLDRRLEGMNEFRAQLKDQAASFLTRNESIATHNAINTALERGDVRIKRQEEFNANLQGRMWAFGVVFTVLNVVLSLWFGTGGHFPGGH